MTAKDDVDVEMGDVGQSLTDNFKSIFKVTL